MNETRGLWRGKRINNKEHNGEWVEGFFYPVRYTGYSIPGGIDYYIVTCPSGGGRLQIQVDPSTLGECTGLTDKNGKLIFEGDIVKIKGKIGRVLFVDDEAGFIIDTYETYFAMSYSSECEVIGNIHDDPGLISERTN